MVRSLPCRRRIVWVSCLSCLLVFFSMVMYWLSLSMRSHCWRVGFGVNAVRKLWIVCFMIDWMVDLVFSVMVLE